MVKRKSKEIGIPNIGVLFFIDLFKKHKITQVILVFSQSKKNIRYVYLQAFSKV